MAPSIAAMTAPVCNNCCAAKDFCSGPCSYKSISRPEPKIIHTQQNYPRLFLTVAEATGAAGAVGSIGRNVTEMLLAKGQKVRALVRREDERAGALRQLGAEVMQGDLTDLIAMHRAIEGCTRVYFGMSASQAAWPRPAHEPRSLVFSPPRGANVVG